MIVAQAEGCDGNVNVFEDPERRADLVADLVEVSLGSVAVSATSLTAAYLITFKNPANNNGRLLSVNTGGCNKAGCSPPMLHTSSR